MMLETEIQNPTAVNLTAREARRGHVWDAIGDGVFDVAIIGAGINGASLYSRLASTGYRVLLVDQGDFAGGTSQASAMMIWGGLLYLKHFRLGSVWKFSAARDRMIRDASERVRPLRLRYLASPRDLQGSRRVEAALHFYWMMGGFRRSRPRREKNFPEKPLLAPGRAPVALEYEEGGVFPSDASFVCAHILSSTGDGQVPMNYCRLEGGGFDRARGEWRLELRDALDAASHQARARLVVNAAGVWVDALNRKFALRSPWRQVFSKGVFIGLERDARHEAPLIFETSDGGDCMAWIPWGPVALWGPTETVLDDLQRGFHPEPVDLRALLDELNRHSAKRFGPEDIVSLRAGVRPLAVPSCFRPTGDSLELSRLSRVHRHTEAPWISVYGGKLTGSEELAGRVARLVQKIVPARPLREHSQAPLPAPEWTTFPGLREPVPSPEWCAENAWCCTLEDYLRRRTNISQWVARGGLGRKDENFAHLARIAEALGGPGCGEAYAQAYLERIRREFDDVIARC